VSPERQVALATPNLFIVGAPKSGTTALSTYLDRHPEIFVAPHEMIYFGTDLAVMDAPGRPRRRRDDYYLATFAPHRQERYRGDHSVTYLYSRTAANEIFEFEPDARIIAMVRDPVDQMHSQHSELVYQGEEDITDFAEALAAEDDRRQGRRVPATTTKPFGLLYREIASYAEQIERYLSVFGPERVHVVVFDDFAADTAGEYRSVLEFLGVDPGFAPSFEVVNPNKVVRSSFARDQLRGGSPVVRRLGRLMVPSARSRARLRRRAAAMNTVHRARDDVDPDLRRRLRQEMAPGIHHLERLLDRDLGAWLAEPT
jgi:hypothetical protein